MLTLKLSAAVLLAAAVTISTGCNPQPKHPNQINAFDGASYDSLTLAHAALSSLRVTVSTTYPRYTPAFNQAAASYTTAYSAYALFRTATTNQAQAALAISDLTVSIVSLENALQTDLHVAPQAVVKVRGRAARLRAAAAPQITISDILTELEIAASIAATVPGTQPYANLAGLVIKTTQAALAASNASAGQPIDLSTIQPIAAI
jgi:hypothetical protein